MNSGVGTCEGQEARESKTTHNSNSLASIALNAPLVAFVSDGVEEVVHEHIGLAILLSDLIFVL